MKAFLFTLTLFLLSACTLKDLQDAQKDLVRAQMQEAVKKLGIENNPQEKTWTTPVVPGEKSKDPLVEA